MQDEGCEEVTTVAATLHGSHMCTIGGLLYNWQTAQGLTMDPPTKMHCRGRTQHAMKFSASTVYSS